MSAPAAASSNQAHAEPSKYYIFVGLAMILAVITGLEILLVYLPLPHLLVFSALALLSGLKFMCVIFIFMHLRWDKLFCTILFFIGLVLAAGTMWALLHLFGAEQSKPLSSAALDFVRAGLV